MGRRDRKKKKKTKQLLYNPKETSGYRELKDEALDHTIWRTRFGRGYGDFDSQ